MSKLLILEEQNQSMQTLMQWVREIKEQSSSKNTTQSEVNNLKSYNMIPKLHCPSFDGTNPRIWLKKYSRYFSLCGIFEDAKVDLASLAMTGKAEVWVTSYLATRQHVEWVDFICDLNARFEKELL